MCKYLKRIFGRIGTNRDGSYLSLWDIWGRFVNVPKGQKRTVPKCPKNT